MKIVLSAVSLFLSLITYFALTLVDYMRQLMIATSEVGLEESHVSESIITFEYLTIPLLFLIISLVFYQLHKKEK